VVLFNFDQLRGKLTRKMNAFSKIMAFEKANTIKFRLNALDKYEKCVESARVGGYLVIADEFKTTFGLQNTPIDIEMYDNSHTAGDCQVSALVRYTNGKKNTSEYRKFNIKTVVGPDDYASFDEVLRRRFTRLLKERSKLPDLVIIDGGKGQLSAVIKILEEMNLTILNEDSPTADFLALHSDEILESIMSSYPARYLSIRRDGVTVATARLAISESWAIVTRLIVAQSQRRQGLAELLMKSAISFAYELGATKMCLQVDRSNPGALALYEEMGFRVHHTYSFIERENRDACAC
jgi:GNAT superfamily N-acetyltransferase